MRIFLTGDTHIPYDIAKLASKNFPISKNLTKRDVVIILGDFGLLWRNDFDPEEQYWTNWLNEKPWTTLFIDGNHENFNRLNCLPKVNMFGSVVGKVTESIFHLKRGNVYSINGKTFLTIGGGQSIDKQHRIENLSWWPQELLSYQEQEHVFDTITKHPKVDYVLTHVAPSSIFDKLAGMLYKCDDPTLKIFEEVKSRIEFRHWYFGHYHIDEKINDYFTVIFEKVILL